MRRQARFSDGGTSVARSASALQVWLWLLLFVFQNEFRISRCIQPGYLYFDNLPDTNFTCAGKVIGGYYADLETSCQMFHVCTVGLQEEPMDIKFLCLNGTVFDQETRVCERVDEVDCTKSERFYSLNLELYGNTAPPIIQAEENSQPKPTEESNHQTSNKPSTTNVSDPFAKESPTTPDKIQNQSTETIDSTEDPIQDVKQDDNKNSAPYSTLSSNHHEELNKEYEEDEDNIDDDNIEYEENIGPTSSVTSEIITTTSTTTTTHKPTTTKILPQPTAPPTPISHFITSASPPVSSFSPQLPSHKPSDAPTSTLDPSLLSPQEFIYRHRGPGSEAISFQRQSFRPADGIYITHAPPQQFDHFQYESSRTAPRPSRPVPFVQRPQPMPFRPTTVDPRDQLLRPSQSSQSSERLETAVKHRIQNYPQHLPPQHLPPQQQLPFNPFYYDRKRSEDSSPENESLLSARSVPPLTVTERILPKPKSPPRVIVTASASVSDSNGKRLNYTVGNVVSDVKPIVAINYDDYKESDLIFDPFFLDVPKLQSRRKTRSSNIRKIVNVPPTATMPAKNIAEISTTTPAPIKSQATSRKIISTSTTSTTTAAWNPEDYVDDNYEPQSYIPPAPPLAVLVTDIKIMKQARSPINDVTGNKIKQKPDIYGKDQTKPTSHAISSQSEATVPVPSPTPIEAPACITSRSTDCRIRA